MRRIDDGELPMPEINPDKVCFVIVKARELAGQDTGVEPDDSNPSDDNEHAMLTDADDGSNRKELVEFIRDLDVDETAALLALAWIGRGDYEPADWRSAVKAAGSSGFFSSATSGRPMTVVSRATYWELPAPR